MPEGLLFTKQDFCRDKKYITFRTIESENTLDVNFDLPISTRWRVHPLRDGIYLQEFKGKLVKSPKIKLSTYGERTRGGKKHLDILPKENSFIISSNDMSSLDYRFRDDEDYISLGSSVHFMMPLRPTFRYVGNLEFVILI